MESKISLTEYQKVALERLNPNIMKSKKESMRYCCMGILEETGEIVSELRKPLYKGNFHEKPLNKEELKGEIGDLIWYMALTCLNNGIDIEELNKKTVDNGEEDRKTLIKDGIKLGKQSGKIVEKYLEYYKGKTKKKELEKALRKQYKNILKLSGELDISMDDILQKNIKKVTGRYKKDGKANTDCEEER